MKKTVFIVDDNETNLIIARDALAQQYRVVTLSSAGKMFTLLEKVIPDLILLDIKMPEMDGFEALNLLKSDASYEDLPVIFLTNISDAAVEARGFQLGVVDFITKPFSAPVLLNRIKTHLDIDMLIRERTAVIEMQKDQLQHLQNSIVYVVADMVEKRDHETGGHIERTTEYIRILLNAMLEHGVYADELSDIDFELLVSSARLHDVGKIVISDTILNKPGKLTDEEFLIMKTHASEGELIINQIISRTDSNSKFNEAAFLTDLEHFSEDEHELAETRDEESEDSIDSAVSRTGEYLSAGEETFLHNAKLFAGYHHERWDGKGYPYGLAGKDIPFQGRIMAFADVYDALISVRPYKQPISHDDAIKIISENAGTQFDPYIAEVFLKASEHFKAVSEEVS